MPCLSFTATMKWGGTECQRLCVLARIDNTRRSSRAETNPSSYGTRLIDRHLPLLRDLRSPTARVSRPAPRGGSQPPESQKPGTGKTDRGTPKRAMMNFVRYGRERIIEALVLPCFLYYKNYINISANFFTLKTSPEFLYNPFVRHGSSDSLTLEKSLPTMSNKNKLAIWNLWLCEIVIKAALSMNFLFSFFCLV